MNNPSRLLGLLLLLTLVLAACVSPVAPPETQNIPQARDTAGTMAEKQSTAEAMTPESEASEEANMDAPEPTEDEAALTGEPTPEPTTEADTIEPTPEEEMNQAELALNIQGLEDLGDGFVYEGWLIVEGRPISSGIFTLDEQGTLNPTTFSIDADVLSQASAFVLTIEPVPDPDPAPSQLHLLAGDFDGDSAELSVGHQAALGHDFAEAHGSFLLGIPTSNSASDSYRSGIWFTVLNLPELPAGWIYEGWVVGPAGPLSTGRFAHANEADSDGAGPTAGPNPGPAFPGQDYLNPPIDLTQGYAAVISIEPEPDTSLAPFALKPLVAGMILDAGDHVDQVLQNNAVAFPSGTASR